jgi:hypothetical protein
MNERFPYTPIPEDLLPTSHKLRDASRNEDIGSERLYPPLTLANAVKDLSIGAVATFALTALLLAAENVKEHTINQFLPH